MITTNTGIIYGFVGPKGGGKTHQLNFYKKQSEAAGTPFITADFSDGIRQTVADWLGVPDAAIEPEENAYSVWKSSSQEFRIPHHGELKKIYVKGRDMLKNVGEGLKELAGKDVWARWTGNAVLKKFFALSEGEQRTANVALGSVRFGEEVQMMFTLSRIICKDVKIIFCNFHDANFDPEAHESEKLANVLIQRGCKEGEDVTQLVKDFYQIK